MPTKTKEPKYQFIVNTLGEVIRRNGDSEDYVMGDVNVATVAKMALTPTEYKRWAKMPYPKTKPWKALEGKVNREINREFERQAKRELTESEYALHEKVIAFQTVNNSRFRVYGGIRGRTPWVKLVTEVQAFVDQTKFWALVEKTAKASGGTVEVMHESEHENSRGNPTKGPYGVPAAKLRKQLLAEGRRFRDEGGKVEAGSNGYIWSLGPNHGRMERQVELWWDVQHLPDVRALRTFIREKAKATNVIWKEHGVGVV